MSAAIAASVVGIGAGVGGSLYSASAQRGAAKDASQAQIAGNNAAIGEQQRQFEEIKKLMQPYVDAGQQGLSGLQQYAEPGMDAFGGQLDLIGLNGPEAERAAIDEIRNGERFGILQELGEESILNRASVTGGLRGGRTQGALTQFAPALLQDLIGERYNELGGIASLGYGTQDALARLGQSSAAQQGAFGQQSANTTAGLLSANGASSAGYALAKGNAQVGLVDNLTDLTGLGLGAFTGGGF